MKIFRKEIFEALLLFTSKDQIRPEFNHIKIKDKSATATNGHVLIRGWNQVPLNNDDYPKVIDDFKDNKDDGECIHRDTIKEAINNAKPNKNISVLDNTLVFTANDKDVIITSHDLQSTRQIKVKKNKAAKEFPKGDQFEKLFVSDNRDAITNIDPDYLAKVAQAAKKVKAKNIKIKINSNNPNDTIIFEMDGEGGDLECIVQPRRG